MATILIEYYSIYESHQICIFLKGFVHGYGQKSEDASSH